MFHLVNMPGLDLNFRLKILCCKLYFLHFSDKVTASDIILVVFMAKCSTRALFGGKQIPAYMACFTAACS